MAPFLEQASELFDLVVFTAAQQSYADKVLDVVDPDAPEKGAIIQIEHEIRSCVTQDGSKYKSCPLREV